MTGHVYDDGDPGPAPGSVTVCPLCPVDRPRDVEAVHKPAGYTCNTCGWWFPATGASVSKRRRDLWNESTGHRPAEPQLPAAERTS